MSKKKTGLLIALSAVFGAAAAGISYYLKYKSFSDELDKDFHDYEEEETTEEKECDTVPCSEAAGRTYIHLDSKKQNAGSKPDSGEAAANEPQPAPTEAPRTGSAVTVEEDTEGENE